MSKKHDLHKLTLANRCYRYAITTIPHSMQIVLMTLKQGETIPREKHPNTTQFIYVVQGKAYVRIGSAVSRFVGRGQSIVIPPNRWHFVKQSGTQDLKLYTIYTPPEHPPVTKQLRQPSSSTRHHHHRHSSKRRRR